MRVYDRFIDEYIDEEDMDPIASPERYVQITEDMLIENATRWLADALKKFCDVEEDPDIEYTIEERKTGKWIEPTQEGCFRHDIRAYAECSECGKKEFLGWRKNFCPNCGADMRGEE